MATSCAMWCNRDGEGCFGLRLFSGGFFSLTYFSTRMYRCRSVKNIFIYYVDRNHHNAQTDRTGYVSARHTLKEVKKVKEG